jgi:hypothetical protein
MLKISHRGNYCGRLKNHENRPDYILTTLDLGFDVEIDVWAVKGELFLGHDKPQYQIEKSFLSDPRLWIHCKNLESAELLSSDLSLNLFLHTEGVVLTTQGFLFTAPGGIITSRSIAVMPELAPDWDISGAMGVCSDYIMKYMLL